MAEKDYYHTLQVQPTATTEEIKKAFRKLALRYHPDKINSNDASGAHFAEVYEAYSVLSDASLRSAYNRRRKDPIYAGPKKYAPATAEDVVVLSEQLKKKLSLLDPFRTDHDLLQFELHYLLSPANIDILAADPDKAKSYAVVRNIIHSNSILPFSAVKVMAPLLEDLSIGDNNLEKQVAGFINRHRRQYLWARYKVVIALAAALLFCLLLVLSGKTS